MENNENKKRWLVAGIILLVAILLFILVFSGKKEQAPAVTTPEPETSVETQAKQEEKQIPAEESQEEVKEVSEASDAITEESSAPQPQKETINVEPQNVVMTFVATSEKDFTYEVYYTVEREVWFDGGHVVEYPGQEGTHKYSIVIPSDKVYRIRLDFGSNPGTVTVKEVYLMGAQEADLNRFDEYKLNQIDKSVANEDGSFTIISAQEDPYIEYNSSLLPE